jgi:hypothetical protein
MGETSLELGRETQMGQKTAEKTRRGDPAVDHLFPLSTIIPSALGRKLRVERNPWRALGVCPLVLPRIPIRDQIGLSTFDSDELPNLEASACPW